MKPMFVQDGYTFADTVPGTPGLHCGLRFSFRPCTGPEARAYLATPDARADDAAAELILSHVENRAFTPVDEATGAAGDPVALTPDTLKKLHNALWTGVLNRVLGYVGPAAAAPGN